MLCWNVHAFQNVCKPAMYPHGASRLLMVVYGWLSKGMLSCVRRLYNSREVSST